MIDILIMTFKLISIPVAVYAFWKFGHIAGTQYSESKYKREKT